MKIALFVGDMQVGGVTTFVLDLGRYFLQAGHAVTVVACGRGAWWPRLAEYGIPHALVEPGHWESAVQHTRRLALHFISEQYDVVFLNNGLGVQYALRGLHLWPDEMVAVNVLHNDLERVYAHALINHAAWNVAVAVSRKVQNVATGRLPGKPILTIPYGIVIPSDSQLATRTAWDFPLRLLFVGGLQDAHKGILRLPLMLAACRKQGLSVLLTVIGDGGDRERLEQAFLRHGVGDLVEMRGQQRAATVSQAMRTHHILLIPSNHEGLPLVSLETQANGCVPIASHLVGIMDIAILDGVSGYLVGVNDIPAYVERIAALAEPSRWQTFSQAGMARAQTFFSVDVMGKRYLDLVEQIADGAYPLAMQRTAGTLQPLLTPQDYLPTVLRKFARRLRRMVRSRGGK